MPLSAVSPNVKESEAVARKRSSQEFIDTASYDTSADALHNENLSTSQKSPTMPISTSTVECQLHLSEIPPITTNSSPLSSPASFTETDFSTSAQDSLPSNAPPPNNNIPTQSTQNQPIMTISASTGGKKRKILAPGPEQQRAEKKQKQEEAVAEKAKISAEKQAAKAERAAKAAEREAAKAAKAAEKARIDAEKEAAKAAKAAEKAKADALKEAKRQKKEEEELAARAKQEKQQNLMASFLKKAPVTPSKKADQPPATAANASTASPSTLKQETEPTKSAYEQSFKPFFVKPGVTMAAPPFEMDSETKEAKSNILDEYIRGERGEIKTRPFKAADIFHIAFPKRRGIIPPSVRKIMEAIHGDPYQVSFSTNSRSESQTEKLYVNAQDQLNTIPMKYFRFHEDVRPAYFGTATTPMTYQKLQTLSRRPAGKILLLAYDYDSEAEWIEDDGEDLDDAEDEEEDVDGDEEMDDFVDDSEAVPTIVRPGFEADSKPISSGLCFENEKRAEPCYTTYNYRLEFLLESLEHHSMIDPFSTHYWPAPAKKIKPATAATLAKGTITSMLAPTAQQRDVSATLTSTSGTLDGKDAIPQDMLEDFKRALISDECKGFSKATVIELLAKKFTSCTKAQVKATLDTIAHRVTPLGEKKKSVKEWALLKEFALRKA